MTGSQQTPPPKDSDPLGTSLAYLAGILLGSVLVAPQLISFVSTAHLKQLALDPLVSSLVLAVLGILFVSIGTFAIYRSFALLER